MKPGDMHQDDDDMPRADPLVPVFAAAIIGAAVLIGVAIILIF